MHTNSLLHCKASIPTTTVNVRGRRDKCILTPLNGWLTGVCAASSCCTLHVALRRATVELTMWQIIHCHGCSWNHTHTHTDTRSNTNVCTGARTHARTHMKMWLFVELFAEFFMLPRFLLFRTDTQTFLVRVICFLMEFLLDVDSVYPFSFLVFFNSLNISYMLFYLQVVSRLGFISAVSDSIFAARDIVTHAVAHQKC